MGIDFAKPFRPGQKKISAGVLNGMVRAIRELRSGAGDEYDAKIISIQNLATDDENKPIALTEYQILGLSDLNQTPTGAINNFLATIVFTGVNPTSDYAGKFAIVQEPIAKGAVGRAKISGISQVKVNFSSAAHGYAEASATGDVIELTSTATGRDGGAEVLWKESGTGSKWAIIRFPVFAAAGGSAAPGPATDTPKNLLTAGAVGTETEYAREDHAHASPFRIGHIKMDAAGIANHTVGGHQWLFCDGSAVSRSTYSALFAAIGTTFGVGDGSTTFNLPDFKGDDYAVLPMGASDIVGRTIGSTVGDGTHVHGGPSHTHTVDSHTHSIDGGSGSTGMVDGESLAHAIAEVQSGTGEYVADTDSHSTSGHGHTIPTATDGSGQLTSNSGGDGDTDSASSYPPSLAVAFFILAKIS